MFSPVKLDVEKTKVSFGYDPNCLNKGSHQKVIVECLSCNRLIHREYRNINAKHKCPIIDGNSKKCFRCKQWKDLSLFNKNPSGSGGRAKMCRECHNSHPSVVRTETNRKARIRNSLSSGDIKYYIRFRTNCIRNIAKRKGIQFDLTAEYMHELWIKQNALCYYTSLPMKGDLKQSGFQSWDSPSVDRKNPSKGYTNGNVVWCTFGVNSFKQSLTESQFHEIVQKIKWW